VCRLFESELNTGQLVSTVASSQVGFIKYTPALFTTFQQPCSQCKESRYLTCSTNDTCQCPVHSFWNGTQCINQRYANSSCLNDQWCRQDPFELVCSLAKICTSKSK